MITIMLDELLLRSERKGKMNAELACDLRELPAVVVRLPLTTRYLRGGGRGLGGSGGRGWECYC